MTLLASEPVVNGNSRDMLIELIGASGAVFAVQATQEGFTDNNEAPELIEIRSQGELIGGVKGNVPAITGSFTAWLLTENNLKNEAFLDVIYGRNNWANESTGPIGSGPGNPFIPDTHVLTMRVTLHKPALVGGPQVWTYKKVRLTWNVNIAMAGNTINVNWVCMAGKTATGPQ